MEEGFYSQYRDGVVIDGSYDKSLTLVADASPPRTILVGIKDLTYGEKTIRMGGDGVLELYDWLGQWIGGEIGVLT